MADGELRLMSGIVTEARRAAPMALMPVPVISAYGQMERPGLSTAQFSPSGRPAGLSLTNGRAAPLVKRESGGDDPRSPAAAGMPVVRGRPFASAARAAAVARKQADLAAAAATEARILGIDDAPDEVVGYADEAEKYAELAEQAAVAAAGFQQAAQECGDPTRHSEFRNRATVVARQVKP